MEPWLRSVLELLTLAAAVGSCAASIRRWPARGAAVGFTACAIVLMGAFAPAHGSAFWLLIAIQLLVFGCLRGRRSEVRPPTHGY